VKKATFSIPEGELREPDPPIPEAGLPQSLGFGFEFAPPQLMEEEENGFDDDLTEEDKTYLRLKWGRTYKPEEWIKLEQLYEEMMGSYDIQTAGHIDTLKMVCKTSLKAN
jgi:hypothetical protein